jgi:hypothetical protein
MSPFLYILLGIGAMMLLGTLLDRLLGRGHLGRRGTTGERMSEVEAKSREPRC